MLHKNDILETIRSTRDISLPSWGNVTASSFKNESPASAVTQIDLEIERFLVDSFAKIDKEIPFVGEEYGGDRKADRFWLCDPIDGTGHYVRGTPFSTTMVALIEDGQVTFSAIYDFVNDIMYHAEKGGGAWENKQRIQVSTRPRNDAYIILETKLNKPENLDVFFKLKSMVSLVCSGYEHVMVAKGQFDGRICIDGYGQDYDFAAGTFLIAEAGGIVANIGSREYDYRNTNYIATNRSIYETLTEGPEAIFPIVTI